jgi:hypothetical protein
MADSEAASSGAGFAHKGALWGAFAAFGSRPQIERY